MRGGWIVTRKIFRIKVCFLESFCISKSAIWKEFAISVSGQGGGGQKKTFDNKEVDLKHKHFHDVIFEQPICVRLTYYLGVHNIKCLNRKGLSKH